MNNLTDDNQEILITKLSVSEWQSYKTLRLRALKEETKAFSSRYKDQVKYTDEQWQKRLATGKHMLFAKFGGKLVGMMVGYVPDPDKDKTTADIVSVYVSPEFRGRCISKKLLETLLKELKEDGVTKTRLAVNKDQLPAFHLYQSFGFIVTGEEESIMADGLKHTELLMSKQL
jgi:ribosomal protein S18 acetylase RimI-like enzyme